MAKVEVKLNCIWDTGKERKNPGEIISIEKKEADSLAAMGMVTLLSKDKSKKLSDSKKTGADPKDNDPGDPGNPNDPDGKGSVGGGE